MKRKTKAGTKRKKRGFVSAALVTLALLSGLFLLLYPTISDYLHSLAYRKEIENYREDLLDLDDAARRRMLEDARQWNAALLEKSVYMGALDENERERYFSLLDPFGTGMMGYIEIEKIQVSLPVYHGTDENVLHSGIGHLEGSSLPVGGTGTHTFLSGHSGLPSARLFSRIDRLEAGDTFTLHILGEALTYRIESSVVVLPEDAEAQEIDPGQDICTLMTCTPYGVNTHRLLVRGVRIKTAEERQP